MGIEYVTGMPLESKECLPLIHGLNHLYPLAGGLGALACFLSDHNDATGILPVLSLIGTLRNVKAICHVSLFTCEANCIFMELLKRQPRIHYPIIVAILGLFASAAMLYTFVHIFSNFLLLIFYGAILFTVFSNPALLVRIA